MCELSSGFYDVERIRNIFKENERRLQCSRLVLSKVAKGIFSYFQLSAKKKREKNYFQLLARKYLVRGKPFISSPRRIDWILNYCYSLLGTPTVPMGSVLKKSFPSRNNLRRFEKQTPLIISRTQAFAF